MRYNDNRILKIRQEVFQPVNGINIQVVRRLIEQQDVRIAKQRLCEEYAHLFTASEIRHLHIML